MNDRKNKPEGPRVEVIRRAISPTPSPSVTPRAVPLSKPVAPRSFGAPVRPSRQKVPPSTAQVESLARKEKVPNRIARGELEGKMKCRIWRKLHAEEARRFDEAYLLLSQHPQLTLPDAFGVLQAKCSVEEFLARKDRQLQKDEVRKIRQSLPNTAVEALLKRWEENQSEMVFVQAERTSIDRIVRVEPIHFVLERSGELKKLQTVLLAEKALWEALSPGLPRDARLAQKPVPVSRQPSQRPVSDPRPFGEHLGTEISVLLRNGLRLSAPLMGLGPFDLVLGQPGRELLIPLHAIIRWNSGNLLQ